MADRPALWDVTLRNDGRAPALEGEPLETEVVVRADDPHELRRELAQLRDYYAPELGWTVGEPRLRAYGRRELEAAGYAVHVAGEPLPHGQYCTRCGGTLVDGIPWLEGRVMVLAEPDDGGSFEERGPGWWPPGAHVEVQQGGGGATYSGVTGAAPTCRARGR